MPTESFNKAAATRDAFLPMSRLFHQRQQNMLPFRICEITKVIERVLLRVLKITTGA
jgi:hypothetical protein